MTQKLPKTFDTKNGRRHDLINKKFDEELSSEEEIELAGLTQEINTYLKLIDPLPLEEVRDTYSRLLLENTLKEMIVELTAASIHSNLSCIFDCIEKAKNNAIKCLKELDSNVNEEGKPSLMSEKEWNYKKMAVEFGDDEAKHQVIEALRNLANKLEYDDHFYVYSCDIRFGPTISSVEVVGSYPWGG